ncbi:MAG: thioredoxin domain-containing protein [Flavobacteriales bacterium]|nr:thioredoxin domain-containing protein [Flavobacteriales bacterium]
MNTNDHQHTNQLISETSPYLLQHAHNPVDWHPWSDKTLQKARDENKLILVSIGYSACHWCHVMEHESFEDEDVARVMNEHFISIKVDREERPDIDQIYMNAVQLMTGSGGWPLNCFALPDGRPFYGGTYFPKQNWLHILNAIAREYREEPEKVSEYADQVTAGIQQSDTLPFVSNEVEFSMETLEVAVSRMKRQFDWEEGGMNRAPKFPMPNNYEFLLNYYYHSRDTEILKFVELTLEKMAFGGIYDQIGGGFARYSVDAFWKVPHFEKMLYDNAQLVTLYAQAYQLTKNPLYKQIVYQTLDFIKREMTVENGAFYTALDADSEGVEGKYYVWTKEEMETLLGHDFPLAERYYNLNHIGKWENHYILLRREHNQVIAHEFGYSEKELADKIDHINQILLEQREKRVRPGLDDKSLTSWNAMMLKGYADAFQVFNEPEFLTLAQQNAAFIVNNQIREDGGLNHNYKNGISNLDGFLEDYAFTIEALLSLYQADFEENWLVHAKQLADYTIEHFFDPESGFFFFTPHRATGLIARKMELGDNVIPASNSCMAKALFLLGEFFAEEQYSTISRQMLKNMESQISQYLSGYSNWGVLMLWFCKPFYEVAITGNELLAKKQALNTEYIPNKLFAGSTKGSNLPLLANRYVNEKTMIYVCCNKTCQKPTENVAEAMQLLS